MTHIKITKGLDIPIKGKPYGGISPLVPSGLASSSRPQTVSLNLNTFDEIKFRLLAKQGEIVKIGQPLVEDKSSPGRMFCSPGFGVIKEIRRGARRSLLDIVIQNDEKENYHSIAVVTANAPREKIIEALKEGGLFAKIRSRPFSVLANPEIKPRNIFVQALESAPFIPPSELQIVGYEKEFQEGLNALAKLTDGKVHLVHHINSTCRAFTEAKNVIRHTAEGPHPVANPSVHIHFIDPILSAYDVVWTLNAHTVVAIGYLLTYGKYFIRRVIGIGGPAVLEGNTGYYEVQEGEPISRLISGRINTPSSSRLISGDPLMGHKVKVEDYLGFSHFAFSVIPENTEREFLHFFRLGFNKYSFSKTYASGHLDNRERTYDFTTSLHGEHRAFIDPALSDEVMPLPIPTMHLIKSVMAEDFELAEKLGFLSVDVEDFALPTFVCPSKVEMTDVVKQGLRRYAADILS